MNAFKAKEGPDDGDGTKVGKHEKQNDARKRPHRSFAILAPIWAAICGFPWGYAWRTIEVIAIVMGVVVAYIATQSSDESKRSATAAEQSAKAAESHAKTADDTYKLAQKGNVTARQHAEAARSSAEAGKISAEAATTTAKSIDKQVGLAQQANDTAKDSAASARTFAESSRKSADAAATANTLAAYANVLATSAKDAAISAAASAKASNALAKGTAIHELRAYLSVMGGELKYDNKQLLATVVMENTGRTPAHQVQMHYDVRCNLRPQGGAPAATVALVPAVEIVATPGTLGPRARFSYQKPWQLGTTNPQLLNVIPRTNQPQMDMWMWGRVDFLDEFTDTPHFTEFSFTQGRQIDANHWEMVYNSFGNSTDRTRDRPQGGERDPLLPSAAEEFTSPRRPVERIFKTPGTK